MAIAQSPRRRAERLEARITPDQKELIERAALLQGRTVTDFVLASVQEAARKAIDESSVWRLTQEQQAAFVAALLDPPAPNAKLRGAWSRYKKYKTDISKS